MPELIDRCYMPPYQLGLHKGIGCTHAMTALSSVFIDTDKLEELLVLGSPDFSCVFDLIIHMYIPIELYKCRVSTCIICTLYNMYAHLTFIVNLSDRMITEIVIPVHHGIREGDLMSPNVFNN